MQFAKDINKSNKFINSAKTKEKKSFIVINKLFIILIIIKKKYLNEK